MNILITGGSRGIGKSLVEYLNKNNLVITTYNTSIINNEHAYKMDVSNYQECQKVLSEIIDKYKKIDVLINNAGIIDNVKFENMTYEQWYNVINTNLNSLFNVTQIIVKNMLKNNSGKIINISSIYGLKGSIGQTNYCASKFGIVGFTKSLALELANKNITVNTICPGLVNTDLIKDIKPEILEKVKNQIPNKHILETNELCCIVDMILNSNSMTGSVISIDGGMSC